jgi:oxygen-independent coproporphyrinogen III oxidase
MTNPLNIYIHIPFCKAKCNYCHFFTFANKENEIPEYFGSLDEEIVFVADSAKEYEIQTIYIGGGTPSLVDGEIVKNMLSLIHKHYNVSTNAEITIEANPESISKEKAEAWITTGINRVSIGVQAWQDRLLKQVNRLYTIEEFKSKLQTIKQAGLNNINLDLIFGLPGQTFDDWRNRLMGL